MAALVAIVMGSQSDWPTMRCAAEALDRLEVPFEARIVSAHRTPDRLAAFAKGAADEGFARTPHSIDHVVQALLGELGQCLGHCPVDNITAPDEIDEGAIGDHDPLLGAFQQRHESRSLLEHESELFAPGALCRHIVEHDAAIQQGRAGVTAVTQTTGKLEKGHPPLIPMTIKLTGCGGSLRHWSWHLRRPVSPLGLRG